MQNQKLLKRIFFLVVLKLLCSDVSLAQSAASLQGSIVDSATSEVLSRVTISLYVAGGKVPVQMAVSGSNGRFEFKKLSNKKYRLVLTYLGYQSKTLIVPTVSKGGVNLGLITLIAKKTPLKQVNVQGRSPLIQFDLDKITYNLDADPDSRTSSILEILRKVPSISLNGDDEVQLNGNPNFRVLINGKTSSLFVQNPSDIFKSMPASMVKSIELITAPPSRYDAEGIAGVINIVTRRKAFGGYNGGFNVGASHPEGLSIGSYLTGQTGKIGFTATLGTNGSNSPMNISNFLREDKVRLSRLKQNSEINSDNLFRYLGGEITYQWDSLNILTMNVNLTGGKASNKFNQRVDLTSSEGQLIESFRNINSGKNSWFGQDLGLDYKHTFKNNINHSLSLFYKYGHNHVSGSSDFSLQPVINYVPKISKTNNEDGSEEHTLRLDYVQPFSKQTLEAGVQTIIRLNNNNYLYEDLNLETGSFITDPALSKQFNYDQAIYAGYMSGTVRISQWGFKIGARVEKTFLDANFASSGTLAKNNYLNLIPNISISRMLKNNSSIKLAFSRRIERPALNFLNPYVEMSNPRDISFGNPQLEPATSNVFTAGYNAFRKSSSINISLFHSFTNNSIQPFTTLGPDTVARTTFGNIGRNLVYGLSLSTNTSVMEKLSINVNSGLNYLKFSRVTDGTPRNNEGFTYNLLVNSNYRFNKSLRASGSMGYNSSAVISQGKTGDNLWNEFTLNKDLLKSGQLTLTFSVKSPLQKSRRSFREVNDPAYYQLGESRQMIRRFNFSCGYRFTKLEGSK